MPIGAIATSGRVSAAFAYVTMFFVFILLWFIAVFAIEIIANVFAATIIETVASALSITLTVPELDLPDPFELLNEALITFGGLYGIGNTILYGFIETVFFGLAIVFGIPGAFMGPGSPFNRVKDFLMKVSDIAGDKTIR